MEKKIYCRVCDHTGEGMNEGFVVAEDSYIKKESDLVKILREELRDTSLYIDAKVNIDDLSDEELMTFSHEELEFHYWTEWSIEDAVSDNDYYVKDGDKLIHSSEINK